MSAPSGQDFRQQYYPPGSTRFSARGVLLPAVGVGEKGIVISYSDYEAIGRYCFVAYFDLLSI